MGFLIRANEAIAAVAIRHLVTGRDEAPRVRAENGQHGCPVGGLHGLHQRRHGGLGRGKALLLDAGREGGQGPGQDEPQTDARHDPGTRARSRWHRRRAAHDRFSLPGAPPPCGRCAGGADGAGALGAGGGLGGATVAGGRAGALTGGGAIRGAGAGWAMVCRLSRPRSPWARASPPFPIP